MSLNTKQTFLCLPQNQLKTTTPLLQNTLSTHSVPVRYNKAKQLTHQITQVTLRSDSKKISARKKMAPNVMHYESRILFMTLIWPDITWGVYK